MNEKTIKTDEVVHDELERLKREYGVETFNGVLRRELGIDPGTDVDKLAAYLGDELRSAVNEVITEIDDVGQIERNYKEEYGTDYLTFEAAETGREVADIGFRDGSFTVRYRDSNGEMKKCGRGYEGNDGKVKYATIGDLHERYEIEDVQESVQEKVSKSYRRWQQE